MLDFSFKIKTVPIALLVDRAPRVKNGKFMSLVDRWFQSRDKVNR
jgi:hypothetical protein